MKTDDNKIIAIIPAFNESGKIASVVDSLKKVLPSAAVIVIDDCSTDETGKIAGEAGALVLTHPLNLGYGSSLETGYLYALENDFDFLLQLDGDGQHLAEELPKLLEPALRGEADIVIGSRYLSGDNNYSTTLVRRLGQKFFGLIFFLLTGWRISDPTSGFQCLSRKAFRFFAGMSFPDDFPDIDVLLAAHYTGFRVIEVPVVMEKRLLGISIHSGLKPLYYIMKMILSIFIVIINRRRWKKIVS